MNRVVRWEIRHPFLSIAVGYTIGAIVGYTAVVAVKKYHG